MSASHQDQLNIAAERIAMLERERDAARAEIDRRREEQLDAMLTINDLTRERDEANRWFKTACDDQSRALAHVQRLTEALTRIEEETSSSHAGSTIRRINRVARAALKSAEPQRLCGGAMAGPNCTLPAGHLGPCSNDAPDPFDGLSPDGQGQLREDFLEAADIIQKSKEQS